MKSVRAQLLSLALLVGMGSASVRTVGAEGAPGSKDVGDPEPTVIPKVVFRTGGRRIESGLRMERTGSSVSVAAEVFRPGGDPQGMELPEHLGGGFLFFQPLPHDGENTTAFYRAKNWTGKLEPLVRVPFPVRHVEAGMDRLYLLGVTTHAALDPRTGELLPLAPLPPVVTIEGIAFDGPYRGLVSAPLIGVLYTEDAGTTWKPLPDALHVQLNLQGTELLVRTAHGIEVVGEGGVLETAHNFASESARGFASGMGEFSNSSESSNAEGSALTEASSEADERALFTLVTRGALFGQEAVAIDAGTFLRLHRRDRNFRIERFPLDAFNGKSCMAAEGEAKKGQEVRSLLFLCEGEGTQVVRLFLTGNESSKTPRFAPLWSSKKRGRLLSWGKGAFLFEGGCDDRESKKRLGCWVRQRGVTTVDLFEKAASPSGESYAVSARGAYRITVDSAKGRIQASSLVPLGRKPLAPREWILSKERATSRFLQAGTLLRRGSILGTDLNVWAVLQDRLVGVELGDGKEPSFGPIQRPLGRALIDGPRAMLWGAAGFAKQSVDGGQSFHELALPYQSGDAELSATTGPDAAVTMGCSSVGCVLGRFYRLGWTIPQQREAMIPKASLLPRDATGRFQFSCGAGDVNSRMRRAEGPGRFPSFWEIDAPRLAAGFDGVSVGFPDGLLRLYAYGPAEADWAREGNAIAYFVDKWNPAVVKKTAPSPRLFESLVDAQTRLGLLDRVTSTMQFDVDPSGRAGAMLVGDRSSHRLLTFAEGEPMEVFEGLDELGLRNLIGVVESRGSLVAAFLAGAQFIVVRLQGGELKRLATLPVGESGERGVDLVRTQAGDLGVVMDGDEGLFVYPLSEKGELGQPIVVPPLASRPPVCQAEATGFLIERELSVAPYLEVARTQAPLAVTRPRALFIVGYDPICLESMVAFGRTVENLPPTQSEKPKLPLSIINTDAEGRRLRLYCE